MVGLYVAPPAHAVVLSVDEKSQIQALDRMPHHMGVQMTPLAGIDLQRGDTGGADAFGVVFRFQVTFDHGNGVFIFEDFYGWEGQISC